jgi:hypothetical protein
VAGEEAVLIVAAAVVIVVITTVAAVVVAVAVAAVICKVQRKWTLWFLVYSSSIHMPHYNKMNSSYHILETEEVPCTLFD